MPAEAPSFQSSDVDSALPIDLDPPASRFSAFGPNDGSDSGLPDVQIHKFGGSIVNSVTLHRFPGDGKGLADEDVVILRYACHSRPEVLLTRTVITTNLSRSTR